MFINQVIKQIRGHSCGYACSVEQLLQTDVEEWGSLRPPRSWKPRVAYIVNQNWQLTRRGPIDKCPVESKINNDVSLRTNATSICQGLMSFDRVHYFVKNKCIMSYL